MLPEERIEKLLPPSKIGLAEARQRSGQVDNASAGGEIKNTQRAGYFDSLFTIPG